MPVGAVRTDRNIGLTQAAAEAALATHGRNRVEGHRPVPIWRRVLDQLRDPLVLVLLAAAVLTVLTGDYADAGIIGFVIVANTTIGVVQEVRADDAIGALAALAAPTARVRRGGVSRAVPAEEIVPGDVLELAEGDVVPADAEVLAGAALLVDESALTGEAVPVDKSPADRLSAGTVVVRGRATARVEATGAASALGRIAGLLDGGPTMTPLQHRLAGLGRTLAIVAAVLCVVVAGLGLLRGQPLELMIVTAISLVVAAVPESLPTVVTLSLALGARHMARRQAIPRRLAAVETLGSVTILATDKTGTLTEGEMVVEQVWTPRGSARVTGQGYGPTGDVVAEAGAPPHEALVDLLTAAAWCNDAAVERDGNGRWRAVGDPTEAALLAAAAKLGTAQPPARLDEVPFDSGRRRMTTLHEMEAGGYALNCKGAPEELLRTGPNGPTVVTADADVLAAAAERAASYGDQGFRVLAVARAVLPERPADLAGAEHDLTLLGLVAIADPPRLAAAGAVDALGLAGITLALITGDQPATARAIAERVGLITAADPVVTGDMITADRPPGPAVRVFARTSPEQKLDVIQAWRDSGEVVAMIGDGVNDGPALRRADIGVAMGGRGTEVARQAADLVLRDDDLATVVAAVEEGRRVYANVRRFLLYGLSGGGAEIVVMLIGPFLGLALPLLPAQILWVNLVTHGLPGIALGTEPLPPGTMSRPPRPPHEALLGAGLWRRILGVGGVIAATSLGIGWWAHGRDLPWQTMLFVALAAAQLGAALGVRAKPWTLANPFLLVAVVAAGALQLLAVYAPFLQRVLGTTALSPSELGIAASALVLGYVAARLTRAGR